MQNADAFIARNAARARRQDLVGALAPQDGVVVVRGHHHAGQQRVVTLVDHRRATGSCGSEEGNRYAISCLLDLMNPDEDGILRQVNRNIGISPSKRFCSEISLNCFFLELRAFLRLLFFSKFSRQKDFSSLFLHSPLKASQQQLSPKKYVCAC